jgi:hypothetical protein
MTEIENNDITTLSKSVEDIKLDIACDDDIDENFSQPQPESNFDFNVAVKLNQSELDEIQNVLKSKSGSELRDYLTKLMTHNMKDSHNFQTAQIATNIQKTYGSSSKREVISVIMTVVNKHNKYIVLTKPQTQIVQPVLEKKESREELRQKLRNKIKGGDKTNMQKMYETLQEEYEKLQEEENPTDTDGGEKKKKKKKKLDPKKLQNQLISQMATYMKNTPGFTGNPTSA